MRTIPMLFVILAGAATAGTLSGPAQAPGIPELRLTGIIVSAALPVHRAIIASPSGEERSYAPGAPLPGGGQLRAIHPDHVIVVRNGRQLMLRFEDETQSGSGYLPRPPDETVASPSPDPIETSSKEAMRAAPVLLLQWLAVEPLMDRERLVGYQVGEHADASLMKDLHLVPGDVIGAINDIDFGRGGQGGWALSESSSPAELRLTVYRQGKAETLRY